MPGLPRALRSARGIAAVAAVAAAATLTVVGQLVDRQATPVASISLPAAIAVCFTAMGAVVLTGAPGHAVGRLMTAAGVVSGLTILAASWSGWVVAAWFCRWAWFPPLGLIFLSLLVFPDGRLPSRHWRALAVLVTTATVAATAALAVAALDHPRTLLTVVGLAKTPRAELFWLIAKGSAVVALGGLIGVLGSLWVRWRRADGQTRQQLACLLPAGALFLVGLALDAVDLNGGWAVAAVVVPMAMTIAVLRYHLYDLDQVINRSLVWLVMTLLVIVGFVAIVALIRDVLMGGDDSTASLVATGLIAVTFEPLRRRVQHGVDHLLYGDRDEPYKVIARLSDLLGRTVDPNQVLPRLARTIAESLQVPYVAVEVAEGPRVIAEHGTATTSVQAFDMVAHGEHVGRLLVAPRTPGAHFTTQECRLMRDVALHAAVATEATRLTRDLQRSRERLIVAREEERRRLRRDLHDGLGPALAGMSMQVRAAYKLLTGQSRVRQILDALSGDLQMCTSEVRQLVDQLRPAALDQGLEAALRAECRRFDSAALRVELHVADPLGELPAAIEVAAYRILGEALTNVVRHSRAQTCRVTVGRRRSLALEIIDDGIGIASGQRRGVGLSSMRERATELGGDCTISDAVPHGTAISVRLPIALGATPVGQLAGAP
jgi:signal transduction histidine kinase